MIDAPFMAGIFTEIMKQNYEYLLRLSREENMKCDKCGEMIYINRLCKCWVRKDGLCDLDKFKHFLDEMGIKYAYSDWEDGDKRIVPLDKDGDSWDVFEFDKEGKLVK